MKTLIAALALAVLAVSSAHAVADPQFDGSMRQNEPGYVAAGPGGARRQLEMAEGPERRGMNRAEPPTPAAAPASGTDLTGVAGAAVGAGALVAAAHWLPRVWGGVGVAGAALLPVGLIGGAIGAYAMGDKPLAFGLGAAGAGMAIASLFFPPLGLATIAIGVGLGGAGYLLGKKFS